MPGPIPHESGLCGLAASHRVMAAVLTVIWIGLACGVPMRQAAQARAQAHADLAQLLVAGKTDPATIIATFDRSNQSLTAAVTGPCLVLSMTIILLINQLLKLKRRYNAIQRDLEGMG